MKSSPLLWCGRSKDRSRFGRAANNSADKANLNPRLVPSQCNPPANRSACPSRPSSPKFQNGWAGAERMSTALLGYNTQQLPQTNSPNVAHLLISLPPRPCSLRSLPRKRHCAIHPPTPTRRYSLLSAWATLQRRNGTGRSKSETANSWSWSATRWAWAISSIRRGVGRLRCAKPFPLGGAITT